MDNQYDTFLSTKRLITKASGPTVADSALHPLLFPFQRDLTRWAIRKGRTAIFADTGLGKALSVDTPVLTPSGYRLMGDLRIGDRVIGSNGKPCTVQGVYPQGIRPAYRVTFSDGASVVCDMEHLWPVRTKVQKYRGQEFQSRTLREILDTGLVSQEGWRFFIPMVRPVEFTGNALPLDPYLIGVLIGDGSLTTNMPCLSSADDDILARVASALPAGISLLKNTTGYDWRIGHGSRNGHRINPVTASLRDLGLMGKKSETKFIPESYKFASRQDREDLLHGLLDTDGSVSKDNNVEYTTVSRRLAEDVVFLVQSLGGTARIREKRTTGQLAYRMSIALPDDVSPFWLERKASNYHPRPKYQPTRAIVAIDPVGDSKMICIAVDAPDSCYVIDHCIVTHNTFLQLEWARLIAKRALIVAPLSVVRQTVREARKISLTVHYTRDGKDIQPGINITNYEQVEHFDAADFDAVILDESSILKSLDGKTKQRLTEMFADTPYRLCCTATPAPNDIAEIANHAEFLGIMSRADMLATFFVHDDDGWRLKGHAKEPFFRWMASWSMSVRKPSDLGYADDGYILPALTIEPLWIATDFVPEGQLFYTDLDGLKGRLDVRKGTIEYKVNRAAEIINASDAQWIVWCGLNPEANALAKLIPGSVNVQGSDTAEDKAAKLEAFQDGAYRVLITKAKIAGFGMNFQNAHNMAFVGLSDSWEAYYQCIRREYRFGQTQPVNVKIILTEQEEPIYRNVMRKEAESALMAQQLIDNVQNYAREEILSAHDHGWQYSEDVQYGKNWTLYLGDSAKRLAEIAPDSIGMSVFSPPFMSLYTYSPTERDLGNSRTPDEFFQHFGYITDQLLRVTMPGRLCCVHVADIPAMLVRDGYIGMKDFPGLVIKHFEERGWTWSGRAVIRKNPQAQAIRTHAKALLFAQLRKDASWTRPAILDQILVFQKPGTNPQPILPDISNDEWIDWASGIWEGISESDTLQYTSVHTEEDERHICPLQLGTIERCVRLWSNKGETVLSAFAGIGSEGYTALKFGRKFVGCELKPEYWKQAIRNLTLAEEQSGMMSLFDLAAAV